MASLTRWRFGAAMLACLSLAGGGASAEVILAGPEYMHHSMERLVPLVSERTGVRLRVVIGEERALLSKLTRGAIPFVVVCRHLTDAERSGAALQRLGHDGIAVIVNGRNPVTHMEAARLTEIFSQRTTRWKDAGGADKPIVRVVKEKRALPYVAVGGVEPFPGESTAGAHVVNADLPAILFVAVDPYAIGYVGISEVARLISEGARVKMIAIDGMMPTSEHLGSGAYSLAWPVHLASGRRLAEAERKVKAFLLGPEGRRALFDAGMIAAQGDSR